MENIVLVGRTGNGKSSTGNSIVGKNVFATKADFFATCECESGVVQTPAGGPKLRVIDTPGLLNRTFTVDYISKEIVRCLHLAEGGLDAVVLVLSVSNRLTKDEETAIRTLKVLFGSEIVDYLIVVFTGGDVLEEDNETIESYLDRCPDFLKTLLASCEQRMVVFDNKTENEGKKTKQFQELLNTIDLVRKHTNYKPYTEDMYHKITEEVDGNKTEHEELEKKEVTEEELEEVRPVYKFASMGVWPAFNAPMGMTVGPVDQFETEYVSRRGMTSGFEPKLTESVLLQMRSKTEAQKAREDKLQSEEEKRLEEMQNMIDQMQ